MHYIVRPTESSRERQRERERKRERERERERGREGEKEEWYGQNYLTCQCRRHSCKKLRLCVYERLLPRRQVMFHRSITNSSFARMAPITAGYRRSLCWLQISDERGFWKTSHSLPITPEVEKTRGVKTPRSMLTTCWQYWRFFSCSFLTSCAWISDKVNSSALGWVTRMSKKASCCLVQNPRTLMSRRASVDRFANLYLSDSFSKGRTTGSTSTSEKVVPAISAMQVRAWSTGMALPHTHVDDIPSRGKPKRRHIASRQSLLFRTVPLAKVGSVVSQEETLLFSHVTWRSAYKKMVTVQGGFAGTSAGVAELENSNPVFPAQAGNIGN